MAGLDWTGPDWIGLAFENGTGYTGYLLVEAKKIGALIPCSSCLLLLCFWFSCAVVVVVFPSFLVI